MATQVRWNRDQLLLALRLYCCTPFGKLHRRNPEIVATAKLIERTPDALAMKACNFASLDPAQKARGVRGLPRRSKADEHMWEEFRQNSELFAVEAQEAFERLIHHSAKPIDEELCESEGPTEIERVVRARRVQSFFRRAVLISYDYRCALTGIAVAELLTASHIIPWNADEARRADPSNGLCLNALHDRAFDRGLIALDDDLKVFVSPRLKRKDVPILHTKFLLEIEGESLQLPPRFQPDRGAIKYHRINIFQTS